MSINPNEDMTAPSLVASVEELRRARARTFIPTDNNDGGTDNNLNLLDEE